MIDKVVRIDDNNAVLIFADGMPFRLYASEGNIMSVVAWFLSPTKLQPAEYTRAVITQTEDTCDIILKVA